MFRLFFRNEPQASNNLSVLPQARFHLLLLSSRLFFTNRSEKKGLAALMCRQPCVGKTSAVFCLFLVACDFISQTLLRPSVISALVVLRPIFDFFLADPSQRFKDAMFGRSGIVTLASSVFAALIAVVSHNCLLLQVCADFSTLPPGIAVALLRARLAFNNLYCRAGGF